MVVEPGTGFLVHKKYSDKNYSLVSHPLNNKAKYLIGRAPDPAPVLNARPAQDTEIKITHFANCRAGWWLGVQNRFAYRIVYGSGTPSIQFNLTGVGLKPSFGEASATIVATAEADCVARRVTSGSAIINLSVTASATDFVEFASELGDIFITEDGIPFISE
jgi:hypothetical protein